MHEDEASVQGLSITADDDWSVESRPLSDAPEWDGSAEAGDSDAVYQYTGPEGPVDVHLTADFEGSH